MLQKVKPIRDKAYLDFIRNLPCIICGHVGSEAHHEATMGNGTMGGKPGDDRTLPLCYRHHAFGGTARYPGSRHGMGKLAGRSFWGLYDIDPEAWIIRLNSAFQKSMGRAVGQK
ncbi:DUF968 domain-containing protein [Geobacter sp. SVR]|uniref:DUF968 domain-containing protein n=1 Tax=Geobacter sp. SVR TaxID=2495594 RepID=UPI00143EF7F4|nr:DUF968 domain-containing protein [Geobacter sp. SVR]BCS54753.1 hypothetical protein GSVR_30610 [Geobacter sp. SVR]GCF86439.1 hypothetical protein GSbR_30390 [Geobacter sp. SVR]